MLVASKTGWVAAPPAIGPAVAAEWAILVAAPGSAGVSAGRSAVSGTLDGRISTAAIITTRIAMPTIAYGGQRMSRAGLAGSAGVSAGAGASASVLVAAIA